MSLLEGHGNFVMTELGRRHVAGEERMARVLHQRRNPAASPGSCTSCSASSRRCGSTRSASGSCAASSTDRRTPRARPRLGMRPRTCRRSPSSTTRDAWLDRVDRQPASPVRFARAARCARAPYVARRRTLAARRPRRRPRSSSAVPVAPTRSRCSRSCAPPVYDACAVYVDHGLRAGRAHDAEVVAAAAARFGAGVPRGRVEVDAGGNLEARARDARYAALEQVRAEVGAASRSPSGTRATTRPRRCC